MSNTTESSIDVVNPDAITILNANGCNAEEQACASTSECCNNLQCSSNKCQDCEWLNKPCPPNNQNKRCCDEYVCNSNNRCVYCVETDGDCGGNQDCCSQLCGNNGKCLPALTFSPSKSPTSSPTHKPTQLPSKAPSRSPTRKPTQLPSRQPSTSPTHTESKQPSNAPSNNPTQYLRPSSSPTAVPVPKRFPTAQPSIAPSQSPYLAEIRPRDNLLSSSVTASTTVVFVGAFIALAAFFVMVRRRARYNQFKSMEEARRNRKFATRKSISDFMAKLEKNKEDFLIDPRRLDLGRVIGVGSHGVVYEGRYQGDEVAVKELVLEDDEKEAKDSRKRFLQEMLALHRLRHPNIVKLIGVGTVYTENNLSRTFFFVMELAKCSLRDLMQDDTMRVAISTMPKSLSIARQVCDGLAYMHHMKLIHLDLKPENILITETNVAKICDLGLSEVACSKPQTDASKKESKEDVKLLDPAMQELQGTSPYIAPELVTDYRNNAPQFEVTFAADIYSLGIVIWELLHAPMPSHPLSWDPYRILVEVKYNNYRPRLDPSIPPRIANIIRQCWDSDPAERPDLQELSAELGIIIEETSAIQYNKVSSIVAVDELRQSRRRELSRSAML